MATKYFVYLDENGLATTKGFVVGGDVPAGSHEICELTFELLDLVAKYGFNSTAISLTTVKGMIE